MGFVSRVVQGGLKGVEEEALKMGKLIASKSPVAVLGTKNILNCESGHGGVVYTSQLNTLPQFFQIRGITRERPCSRNLRQPN